MVEKIYFDLDGVLADFERGVKEIAGFQKEKRKENIEGQDSQMWEKIARVPNFYDKLELMPGAKEMFDNLYCVFGERLEILTGIPKPKRNIRTAAQDKKNWVHRMFDPAIKVHTVYREEKKDYCKGAAYILVDDLEKNIAEWEEYGGTGILFYNAESTIEELLYKISLL